MAKLDLMQFAAGEVPEGETAISAVKVNWNGMVPPAASTTGIAALSAGVVSDADQADPNKVVAFPSARQMVLVLTEYRLLVWSLGFSGKPKDYIGDVPLTAILSIQFGGGGFGDIVRIAMASSAEVDVEIMRGEPAQEFVDAVASRLAPPNEAPHDWTA